MENTKQNNPFLYNALSLAFIGDGVYSLLVREMIIAGGEKPIGELHKLSTDFVNATAQACVFRKIEHMLNEKEIAIFKRGRNARTGSGAKNSTNADYHTATGLEALYGFLHLSHEAERIREIFLAGTSD